jgi:H+/Cl- antiporter ClcA
MKKLAIGLFAAAIAALFGWAYYWAFDLFHGASVSARIDHHFTVAAYTITWVIQLGYLARMGLQWRSQKRDAERASRGRRSSGGALAR